MIITQFTHFELEQFKDLRDMCLVVESQVYGQISDFLYHVASSKDLVDEFGKRGIGRAIKDTGRTPGFWQNLAGSGIYKVSLVNLQNYPKNVSKILLECDEAKLTYTGKTWKEIINLCPFNNEFKIQLGINDKPASKKRKTAK